MSNRIRPLPIPNGANLMISSRCGSLALFDNKDSRAINIDNELRSIKIEKMTVNEYCTKIRSMEDRLKNLGGEVSDKNLVIYTINGLDSRFATLVEIIRHRETLPSFETTRTMLLLKESSFNDSTDASITFESSSSSPTILMASSSSDTKGNTSTQSKSQNLPQLCNHFSRGTCKFGDMCKFIHDHQNRVSLNPKPNSQRTTVHPNNWGSSFSSSPNSQAMRVAHTRPMPYQPQAYMSPVHHTPADPVYLAHSMPAGQAQPSNSSAQ
ncbi:hybrid signal transduction histidine kinase M [Tanacetum coccineum]